MIIAATFRHLRLAKKCKYLSFHIAQFGDHWNPVRTEDAQRVDKEIRLHSLARQHEREAVDLGDLLVRVQLVALEVAHIAHAHQHAPELPSGDTQWLEQRHVYLMKKIK